MRSSSVSASGFDFLSFDFVLRILIDIIRLRQRRQDEMEMCVRRPAVPLTPDVIARIWKPNADMTKPAVIRNGASACSAAGAPSISPISSPPSRPSPARAIVGEACGERAGDARSIGFGLRQVDEQLPSASEIRGKLAVDQHDLRADRAGWAARQAAAGLALALRSAPG